jgi:hypothetical protein
VSATDGPRASTTTPFDSRKEHGSAFDRDEIGGATQLVVNMRVGSLLMRHARRRVVTRMFGVPEEDQSILVSITLLGAAATVVGGVAMRRLPRPSGTDLAIGGAMANTGLRGIAGPPANNIPLAGALIGIAVLSHSLRPAVSGSVRNVRRTAHALRAVVAEIYGFPRG